MWSGLLDIEGNFARRAYFVDAQCSPLGVLLGDAEKNATQTREPTGTRTHGRTVKGTSQSVHDDRIKPPGKRTAGAPDVLVSAGWASVLQRQSGVVCGKQRQHDDMRVGTGPALLPAPRLVKQENKS